MNAQGAFVFPKRKHRGYWATTPLSETQLAGAIAVADNQDELVLAIFRRHAGEALTPSTVWKIGCDGGRRWLLTSVRRSISNLTDGGFLKKTGTMVPGPYGKPEHAWALAGANRA